MNIINIPALADNYIWLLENHGEVIIIDPGEAQPVITWLQQHHSTPTAILLTHHHRDHTNGIKELLHYYPLIQIYGPEETLSRGATHCVHNNDIIHFDQATFHIIATPGHTLGHICYYSKPYLFCGDTLFSAGCGRLFEGTAEQMFHSLQKLVRLADDTFIYCAHEYTLQNLLFSNMIMPDDLHIKQYLEEVKFKTQHQIATLPSTLKLEKKINLFLRSLSEILISDFLSENSLGSHIELFRELRALRDDF